MTNSQALGTARTLRVHLESIQAHLDQIPQHPNTPTLRAARTLTAISLDNALELETFLEELQERTLNPKEEP